MAIPVEIADFTSSKVVLIGRKNFHVGPLLVPGIAAAAAYAVNDQMGSVIAFTVPKEGTIVEVRFYDLDDEGLDKELWLFRSSVVLAADNAAFSLTDAGIMEVEAVFLISTWRDAVNAQVGLTANTPASYRAPAGVLYGALKTLGTDNITAGSEPRISLVVET